MALSGIRTLADLAVGSGAMIARSHRTQPGLLHRLAELGFRPGASVRMLMHTAGGGRLVAVGHSRVVIGRELLHQVQIEPVEVRSLDQP